MWRTTACFVILPDPPGSPPADSGHSSSDVAHINPQQFAHNDIKIEVWMRHQSRERGSADPESPEQRDRGGGEGGRGGGEALRSSERTSLEEGIKDVTASSLKTPVAL